VTYDASPQTARVPLTAEDVEALLLTDAAELTDRHKVRHVLTRMRATFAAHADRLRALQREVERRAEADRRRADPVKVALDALAELGPDDLRLVMDRRGQALVDAVVRANAEALEARAAAASETNRARLVLAWAAERPGLTDEVRAALAAAVEQLPLMRQPAPVPVPDVGGGAVG